MDMTIFKKGTFPQCFVCNMLNSECLLANGVIETSLLGFASMKKIS